MSHVCHTCKSMHTCIYIHVICLSHVHYTHVYHMHVTCRLGIRKRRTVESDTVSLCDVTGERERRRGGERQGGNESPLGQHRINHHLPVSDDAQELSSLLSVLPHPTPTPTLPAANEGVDTNIPMSSAERGGAAEMGGATGGQSRRNSGWSGNKEEQTTKEVRPIMVWNEHVCMAKFSTE